VALKRRRRTLIGRGSSIAPDGKQTLSIVGEPYRLKYKIGSMKGRLHNFVSRHECLQSETRHVALASSIAANDRPLSGSKFHRLLSGDEFGEMTVASRPQAVDQLSPNPPVSLIQILRTEVLRSSPCRLHTPGHEETFGLDHFKRRERQFNPEIAADPIPWRMQKSLQINDLVELEMHISQIVDVVVTGFFACRSAEVEG
jgi:hypothetical protein